MNKKLIITKDNLNSEKDFIISALYENGRMIEADCSNGNTTETHTKKVTPAHFTVGNIYVARVQNVPKNLNAAFVEIESGQICYLPLEKMKTPVFTRKYSKKSIAAGDELLVQIEKEAVKTKAPIVTTNISLSGKYTVVTLENRRLGLSAKFDDLTKKRFKELFKDYSFEEAGVIIRTNARDAEDAQVLSEVRALQDKLLSLKEKAKSRAAFTLMYEEEAPYLKNLKNYYMKDIEEIVTDRPELFSELECYLKEHQAEDLVKLKFYEDASYSLKNLYNIKGNLENALKRVVWLKSGANLVIEATEALTVIDVNSGKNTARQSSDENFLKINLEAAEEIARQLRLRNMNGMILVDFINMTGESQEKELVHFLETQLKKDTIPTQFVDITKLGLVEITRKKTRKTLGEQIKYD